MPLTGLKYHKNFPTSWDLADPLPKSFFEKDKNGVLRYIGLPLEEFETAATWATDPVIGEKGRIQYKIRPEFVDEWVHCIKPALFMHYHFQT